jgi:hypothetical protein
VLAGAQFHLTLGPAIGRLVVAPRPTELMKEKVC